MDHHQQKMTVDYVTIAQWVVLGVEGADQGVALERWVADKTRPLPPQQTAQIEDPRPAASAGAVVVHAAGEYKYYLQFL